MSVVIIVLFCRSLVGSLSNVRSDGIGTPCLSSGNPLVTALAAIPGTGGPCLTADG